MRDTPAHICFFNSHKNWGGGEKWHYETSLQLAEKGYAVLFFSNKKSVLYQKVRQASFTVKPVVVKNLSFLNPVKILYIAYYLRKYRVQSIIIALPSDVKAAGIAARLVGVKAIIYRRGTALPVKNSWLNRFLFSSVITDIIANSREIKKRILQKNPHIIPPQKIHVVYNGLIFNGKFPQQLSAKTGNAKPKIILGNVGRLVEQKGQFFLIQLAAKMRDAGISFELRIAGEGYLKQKLKRQAIDEKLDGHIAFFDFVEDIYQFLREVDIFLFPSLHEGTSNVLLEAMAMQKPIVAFRISSMPEIITSYKTGLLANFMDIDDFYTKLLELINDAKLRRELGKNAQELVKTQFNHQLQTDKIIKIINHEGSH